jgi:para-nitrobenzyl esterase
LIPPEQIPSFNCAIIWVHRKIKPICIKFSPQSIVMTNLKTCLFTAGISFIGWIKLSYPKYFFRITALMLLIFASVVSKAQLRVTVESGELAGILEHKMRVFKGIPYAAPPVGPLRWRPPQPPNQWKGVRDASRFCAPCVQPLTPGLNDELVPGSEDCLTLNVFAPSSAAKLPVMVWIHGGAHVTGGSAEDVFTPIGLVRNNVIVVTINYRLGRLGFFASPEIIADAAMRGEPSGNYGMMDMIAALKWVQRNIKSFGGDPGRVTIFGESAGGRSVTWLMISPAARGLFHRAIAESGRATEPLQGMNESRFGMPSVRQTDSAFVKSLGASSIEALRSVPIEKIKDAHAQNGKSWTGPFIDGTIIPGDPVPLFAAGKQAPVPFLLGINSWDASLFAGQSLEYDTLVASLSEDEKAEASGLYHPDKDGKAAVRHYLQDERYGATLKLLGASMNKIAPVYGYYFDYVTASRKGEWPGTPHGWELPYVFGSLSLMPPPDWVKPGDPRRLIWVADKNSISDRKMSDQVTAAWAAFAKNGNPNVKGQPAWPQYDPETDKLRLFAEKPGIIFGMRKDPVDFQMQLIRKRYGIVQ